MSAGPQSPDIGDILDALPDKLFKSLYKLRKIQRIKDDEDLKKVIKRLSKELPEEKIKSINKALTKVNKRSIKKEYIKGKEKQPEKINKAIERVKSLKERLLNKRVKDFKED